MRVIKGDTNMTLSNAVKVWRPDPDLGFRVIANKSPVFSPVVY